MRLATIRVSPPPEVDALSPNGSTSGSTSGSANGSTNGSPPFDSPNGQWVQEHLGGAGASSRADVHRRGKEPPATKRGGGCEPPAGITSPDPLTARIRSVRD
jgi:hypothetical protein